MTKATNVRKKHVELGWPEFLVLLIVQLWAAHALVFFAHEYSHSFVAWALGWKVNPFALNYAHPTLKVLLIQLGINQNVNEVPIFAHHGVQAALISGSGMVLGNAVLTLSLSRWGYAIARGRAARGWGMFCYWVCVASVGNLWDYVPIRVFTDGTDLYQDMYAVEKGFGWSPWMLMLVFGIPVVVVMLYFLLRIEPETIWWLFPKSRAKRLLMAVMTAFVLFDFYGAAGWVEGGPVSHKLSLISVKIIAPVMMLLGVVLVIRLRKPVEEQSFATYREGR